MNERKLLAQIHHPYFRLTRFIVNLKFAFQDYGNLYIVLDLLEGGDLRKYLVHSKKLNEQQASKLITRIHCCLHYIIC